MIIVKKVTNSRLWRLLPLRHDPSNLLEAFLAKNKNFRGGVSKLYNWDKLYCCKCCTWCHVVGDTLWFWYHQPKNREIQFFFEMFKGAFWHKTAKVAVKSRTGNSRCRYLKIHTIDRYFWPPCVFGNEPFHQVNTSFWIYCTSWTFWMTFSYHCRAWEIGLFEVTWVTPKRQSGISIVAWPAMLLRDLIASYVFRLTLAISLRHEIKKL